MKYLIIFLFLANLGWISQASAKCENQDNTSVIFVESAQEKESVFLNIQAQSINPIFSCEFLLKYNPNILQFIEYQVDQQNWVTSISTAKNGEIEILHARLHQYTYWIAREQIFLGALKFKVIKKTPAAEFVFENPVVIELEQFINPKINDQPCWPKKIKLKIQ